MTDELHVRHSKADDAELVDDEDERARREASNALIQADRVRDNIVDALHGDRPFKLRPSTMLDLNRCAIDGLSAYAGNWRPAGVQIQDSKHTPPEGHLVPSLVEELCDYVNDEWGTKSAVHLASFVMWRLNWIHPFSDGNGRTSRAASYLVLCVKNGMLLPGVNTIPDQIVANRQPYYDALEAADMKFFEDGGFSEDTVGQMEDLIGDMLAAQLTSSFDEATA